jgi:hypothetical protein
MTDESTSSVPRPAGVEWYYEREGVHGGPISEETLLDEARLGELQPDTLVWQQAFYAWQEASSVPMLAAILGCRSEPIQTELAVLPQRAGSMETPPQQSPGSIGAEADKEPSVDEPNSHQELNDAVTDEEAADPVIDLGQVREILERASRNPSEPWLPPASVASTPAPAPGQADRLFGMPRKLAIACTCVLAATAALAFVDRQRQTLNHVFYAQAAMRPDKTSASSYPATPNSPTGAWTSSQPPPAMELGHAAGTRLETRKDVTADWERHSILVPAPEGVASSARAESSAPVNPEGSVVVTEGSLDVQLLQNKLERALPVFDAQCWDKLRVAVGKAGKNPSVRIELSIDRAGHLYNIVSSKAPKGYRGAGYCIMGRMRGWKFPRSEQGAHVVVTVARIHG